AAKISVSSKNAERRGTCETRRVSVPAAPNTTRVGSKGRPVVRAALFPPPALGERSNQRRSVRRTATQDQEDRATDRGGGHRNHDYIPLLCRRSRLAVQASIDRTHCLVKTKLHVRPSTRLPFPFDPSNRPVT